MILADTICSLNSYLGLGVGCSEPPSVDAERLMPDTLMSTQLMPGSIDAQEALLMPDSIDARLD